MSGRKQEIAAAYEQYGALVLQRCYYILGDRQRAEDALQEVFVRLLKYNSDLSQIQSPVRWFYRIAENTCYDLLKDSKRHPVAEQEPAEASERLPTYHPLHEIVSRDIVRRLFQGMKDPVARQVLLLYYRDGLTQHRIAEQLETSRQTIHNKLVKIKQQIDKLKKQSGI